MSKRMGLGGTIPWMGLLYGCFACTSGSSEAGATGSKVVGVDAGPAGGGQRETALDAGRAGAMARAPFTSPVPQAGPSQSFCIPTSCLEAEAHCGAIPDGCGGVLRCGTCECGSLCSPETRTCVSRASACELLQASCGRVHDACSGEPVECGDCPGGEVCVDHVCERCVPLTCAERGWMCGEGGDGCGGTLRCGDCASGECYQNQCCQPTTCSSGACGDMPDGCGGVLKCGECPVLSGTQVNVCGLVIDNVCSACTPRTCEQAGAECGRVSDGCGGELECPACPQGKACGIQSANHCAPCTPRDACGVDECGQVSDGCGGTIECGGCGVGEVCGQVTANICNFCRARTCEGATCGTVSDGCGEELHCGGCGAGQLCFDNACCTPRSCGDPLVGCGVVDDGCGGILDCRCDDELTCDGSGSCCRPLSCIDVCAAGPYRGSDGCRGTLVCDGCEQP